MSAGKLKYTLVVRNPETFAAVALVAGCEVPAWAKDLVHSDDLETSKAKASADTSPSTAPPSTAAPADTGAEGEGGQSYSGMKVGELQAEADKRGLEITGSGKDGKVIKNDLVAALEADDAK